MIQINFRNNLVKYVLFHSRLNKFKIILNYMKNDIKIYDNKIVNVK